MQIQCYSTLSVKLMNNTMDLVVSRLLVNRIVKIKTEGGILLSTVCTNELTLFTSLLNQMFKLGWQ